MTRPPTIEPFLEPEVQWYSPSSAHQPGPWESTASTISAAAILLVAWDIVAQEGPFPGLVRPIDLAARPVTVAVGWLLGLGLAAVSLGIWAAHVRGRRPPVQGAMVLPRLPVFLRFDGREVVVVGGGPMAASKIPALLQAGASVTVVAPAIADAIDRTRVRVVERPFDPADLDGAWFVTAAAPPDVNRQVREAAEARHLFVNAVDDPVNATAYLGGTVSRGGITIAISTAGQAPALAGLLREGLEALLPEDLDEWLTQAHTLSRHQRAEGVPMSARRPQLLEALNRRYAAGPSPDSPSGTAP